MDNKQKKEQPDFFKELGCYMNPYKGKYIVSVSLSILSVCFSILSFVFVGFIVANLFSGHPKWDDIVIFIVLAIISKLSNAILMNTSTLISHKAAYFTLKDIRLALTNKMLKLPMGYFEKNGTGRLKTLLVDHVENMEKTLAHMLPELTANTLAPLALMVYMFVIDWRLALASLAWIFIGLMISGGMMKNYNEKFEGQIKCFKGMNQAVVEYVNGIEVIKNFGREDDVYTKYKEAVSGHANYNISWQKECQTYMALAMAIAPFSLFIVLGLGIWLYSKNSIDPSTIFMMCILTFSIFGPIMQSSSYFDQLAGMGTNAKEIKDVLDYPELKRGNLETCDDYSIELKNVRFGYNDTDVIHNINFKVNSGEMLALVGPSGSGKSTIAKLIGGYWDCKDGEITIGGNNITSYSQEYLNKLIAYVDQDTFLFDKSIKDNIKLGNMDASDEEVIEAAKKAGCHDFIMNLNNGYDTLAGECGNKLSGGERQRIAIVRAMMKNAPIMILDEATASTDPENEASIQEALLAASKGKTLIVVAHRLYTIKNADKIAYVENGEVKKLGTHEELLKELEEYRKLWNLSEDNNND